MIEFAAVPAAEFRDYSTGVCEDHLLIVGTFVEDMAEAGARELVVGV